MYLDQVSLYPDLDTALVGTFVRGRMVSAVPAQVVILSLTLPNVTL